MLVCIGDALKFSYVESVAQNFHKEFVMVGQVYSLEELKQKALQYPCSALLIDIDALHYVSSEIQETLHSIVQTVPSTCSVIISAAGYSLDSSLIQCCLAVGIHYFVLATVLGGKHEQLTAALQGRVLLPIATEQEKAEPEAPQKAEVQTVTPQDLALARYTEDPIKLIGVAGSLSRIGTTTQALQLVKYLHSKGKTACYVECNDNGYIAQLKESYENASEIDGGITFEKVDLYYKESTSLVITKGYDVYVFDFGCVSDFSSDKRQLFLEKAIKVIVCGTTPPELAAMQPVLNTYLLSEIEYLFSFVPETEIALTKRLMANLASHTHFAGYTPDPFFYSSDNNKLYEAIFRSSAAKAALEQAEAKKEEKRQRKGKRTSGKKEKHSLFGKRR